MRWQSSLPLRYLRLSNTAESRWESGLTEGENRKGILFGGEDLRVTRVSLRSEISATICVYQGETSSQSSAPDTAAVGGHRGGRKKRFIPGFVNYSNESPATASQSCKRMGGARVSGRRSERPLPVLTKLFPVYMCPRGRAHIPRLCLNYYKVLSQI